MRRGTVALLRGSEARGRRRWQARSRRHFRDRRRARERSRRSDGPSAAPVTLHDRPRHASKIDAEAGDVRASGSRHLVVGRSRAPAPRAEPSAPASRRRDAVRGSPVASLNSTACSIRGEHVLGAEDRAHPPQLGRQVRADAGIPRSERRACAVGVGRRCGHVRARNEGLVSRSPEGSVGQRAYAATH